MNDKLKTCTLVNGNTLLYDHVNKIEQTNAQAGVKKLTLYAFNRAPIGIVAVIPETDIKTLEEQTK